MNIKPTQTNHQEHQTNNHNLSPSKTMSDPIICPVCMEEIDEDEGGLVCDACDTHVCNECLCGVLVNKEGNWRPDKEGVGNHNLCTPCYTHVETDDSLSGDDDECDDDVDCDALVELLAAKFGFDAVEAKSKLPPALKEAINPTPKSCKPKRKLVIVKEANKPKPKSRKPKRKLVIAPN